MENILKNWNRRMNDYRLEADTTKSKIQRVKAMSNFMMLRDCIKEIKQLKLTSFSKAELCQCEDKASKHFIKNWCDDCGKHIV